MHLENFMTFEVWVIERKKQNPNENKTMEELKEIYKEDLKNFYSEYEVYVE